MSFRVVVRFLEQRFVVECFGSSSKSDGDHLVPFGLEIVLLGEAVSGSVSAREGFIGDVGIQNAKEFALEVELKHGRK